VYIHYNESMKIDTSKIEVLSPAGDMQGVCAAINNGANAIYLGLKEFNARGNICNFSFDELKKAVDLAHLYNVKVYLTFNILIKNREIEEAINIVKKSVEIGVDAFILQDIGFAMRIKQMCPEICIHASTQMGIHNLEGAKFLEKCGFSRVVLSRETPLSEIKRIKDNTKLEIEYFVQGALCVSFSGNCYLCALMTGNSGNRGKCQQFCRLPYTIENEKQSINGYMLSAKDFCMLGKLKDLCEAGVISLKIEGRARRPAYIAESTRIYRQCLDNNFVYSKEDFEDLKKVFNRGDFTSGYFENNKIIYPNIQGHKGIKIGKVSNFISGKKFNIIEINSDKEISRGDGLKFIKNEKEIASIGVMDVKNQGKKYSITTLAKVQKDCDVYLTLDAKNEVYALNRVKKLPLKIEFIAKESQKAKLILSSENYKIEYENDTHTECAKNHALSVDDVLKQLSKLGDESFEILSSKIDIGNVFIPVSELNKIRREGIQKLKEKIIESRYKKLYFSDVKDECIKKSCGNIYKIFNVEGLKKLDKNSIVIYSPYEYTEKDILKFEEECRKITKDYYLDLPIFATTAEIEFFKKVLQKSGFGVVANNYYALNLTSKTIIGMGLNVYNNLTYNFYKKLGYDKIILSKELLENEIDEFEDDAIVQTIGREEYMTLKHCPFKEFFGSTCDRCKYKQGVVYKMQNGKRLILERKKVITCQFSLKSENLIEKFDNCDKNKLIEVE